jgi:hypothetical protein
MRANGTSQHPQKDLVKEINALKAQLKKLSVALEVEANDGVSRAVGAIETRSKQAIDSAIEAAQGFIDDYADGAADVAERLTQKTTQMRDAATGSLVDAMEARPLGTLAAILGLGFLAGYLCRRP